jgi:hypothetical protein
MTAVGRRAGGFADWLLVPARAERLALLRILVAGYGMVWLLVRAPHLWDVTDFADDRWQPLGALAGLEGPPAASVVAAIVVVALVSGSAVVVGWRHRLSGPTFALALLLVTTWRNGWGQIFHTENLLVLHVIVLAVVPAAAAWSLDARREAGAPPPSSRFGWPVRVMAMLTVSTYVVAGVAKLRYGGADWLDGDVLAHQIAFDNVRKAAVGSPASPVAGLLLDARWLFTPMALATLVVELGAPFALVSARLARLWVGAAWLFHIGIIVTMVILFAYPVSLVGLAPVLLVHGEGAPLPRVRSWSAGRRRPSSASGAGRAAAEAPGPDGSTVPRPS